MTNSVHIKVFIHEGKCRVQTVHIQYQGFISAEFQRGEQMQSCLFVLMAFGVLSFVSLLIVLVFMSNHGVGIRTEFVTSSINVRFTALSPSSLYHKQTVQLHIINIQLIRTF